MPVLSTVEAQLPLNKETVAKAPEVRNAKKPAASYKPAEVKILLQQLVAARMHL